MMRQYVVRRLVSLLPVIFGVSLITFGLMGLVPGDPAEIIASHGKEIEPSQEQIEAVREELGLSEPVPLRYVRWLGRVVSGDLGDSLLSGHTVWYELTAHLPATLALAAGGMAVGLLIALPVGILSAVWRGSVVDQVSRFLALLGASVPSFWLGTILVLFFAVRLGWLPSMGRGGLRHFVLPCFALGLRASAGEDAGAPARAETLLTARVDGARAPVRASAGGCYRHREGIRLAGTGHAGGGLDSGP